MAEKTKIGIEIEIEVEKQPNLIENQNLYSTNQPYHVIYLSEIRSETSQEQKLKEPQQQKREKYTYGDYDLRDSCVVS
jgi:hypothetical protein